MHLRMRSRKKVERYTHQFAVLMQALGIATDLNDEGSVAEVILICLQTDFRRSRKSRPWVI